MIKYIESQQNKLYKRLMGLKSKKNRDKEDAFIVEGIRFVSEIPKGWEILFCAMSQTFSETWDIATYESMGDIYLLPDKLFAAACDTEHPQGVLVVCKKQTHEPGSIWKKEKPFFVLAEELNDPGNLGTIIRTGDACGVDAIFLSGGSVDVYNPKVLRSTMGSIFHVPIFENVNLEEVATQMRKHNISLYAAHLKGDCLPYDLPLGESSAFLIGNEARGLSEQAANLCSRLVKIPMVGQAESLNASIAAGVLMYEVVRQRLGR